MHRGLSVEDLTFSMCTTDAYLNNFRSNRFVVMIYKMRGLQIAVAGCSGC